MDKKIVFTKTSKGLREASGKTSLLSRDMRNLLKDIDGKSSIRDLLKKLGDNISEADLKEALTILSGEDFIRELLLETPEVVAPQPRIPPQTPPLPGSGGEELDFTSLPPPASLPDEAAASAKTEAEARIKAEVEACAKKEAEARERKAAEENERRKAEAMAKAEADARMLAETHARKLAEERARREAEERVRREAEEKMRREAEEHARKAAEEKARREAEERARKEEAEEQARRETEQIAKREAEERERTQAEEQMQREAEEKSRREAEERARKEAEENARRAAECRAELAAEEQVRQQAEEKGRRKAEERVRHAGEEARARRELAEANNIKLAVKASSSNGGNSHGWGRLLVAALVALPVLGLALIHMMSFGGKIPQLEKAASMQLLQPVRIATLHMSLFPHPHWRLGGVVVGETGQIKAPRVRFAVGLGSMFGGDMAFESIDVDSPVINEEGLAWLLFGKPQGQGAKPGRANVLNARLDSPSISLPAFDVKVETGGNGAWRKMVIESADKALTMNLTSQGEAIQFEASTILLAVPFGSSLLLPDFSAKGMANRGGITLTEFTSRFHGGILSGSAKLKWGRQWSLDGDLGARQIDTAQLLPGLLEGDKLEGKARYAMRAGEAMKLFSAPRLDGVFVIRKGVLLGVDLGRLLQSGETGGKTDFSELSGSFVHERGATQLQQLRLSAGILSANGSAEIDVDKNIRGRLAVDLRMATEQRRANLAVLGTTKAVVWNRR